MEVSGLGEGAELWGGFLGEAFDFLFCVLVFIFAEAADKLPLGVHSCELGAEGIFDVDGFLILVEGESLFAELLGDISHLKV